MQQTTTDSVPTKRRNGAAKKGKGASSAPVKSKRKASAKGEEEPKKAGRKKARGKVAVLAARGKKKAGRKKVSLQEVLEKSQYNTGKLVSMLEDGAEPIGSLSEAWTDSKGLVTILRDDNSQRVVVLRPRTAEVGPKQVMKVALPIINALVDWGDKSGYWVEMP